MYSPCPGRVRPAAIRRASSSWLARAGRARPREGWRSSAAPLAWWPSAVARRPTGSPTTTPSTKSRRATGSLRSRPGAGGQYVPPKGKVDASIDMKTPPPGTVDKMDAATFFGHFAELLKDNPPGPFDYPMIHRLERVGFKVGASFDLNAAPPEIKQAFERAVTDAK